MAGKALTGEVLPRVPRRRRRQLPASADPDAVVALAAAYAQDGLPIYAAVVADTGVDPHSEATRWDAALTAWAHTLTGWTS